MNKDGEKWHQLAKVTVQMKQFLLDSTLYMFMVGMKTPYKSMIVIMTTGPL